MDNLKTGKQGEDSAAAFLIAQGYRIIVRNYRTRLGEIDIIAWDRDTVCFLEVKTRSSRDFGAPAEAISRQKQRKISRAALMYLKEKKLLNTKARFDVVSVEGPGHARKIGVIKNAFELDSRYGY
jgi:putative endonuclease